jgi:hypothetical protein
MNEVLLDLNIKNPSTLGLIISIFKYGNKLISVVDSFVGRTYFRRRRRDSRQAPEAPGE